MFRPRTVLVIASLVIGLLAYASSALDSAFARRADCAGGAADWLGLPAVPPADLTPDEGAGLRVVTYNLHAGLGGGWRWYAPRDEVEANLRRIARHLAEAAPADHPVDVVALNEVDFASRRSGWLDQAAFLAAELEGLTGARYQVVRGPTWERDAPGLEVRFGNAILTRHPIIGVQACLLGRPCATEPMPGPVDAAGRPGKRVLGAEPRGVLRVQMRYAGRPVDLLVTHLAPVSPAAREAQAAELMARHVPPEAMTILLGDFNAVDPVLTRQRPYPDGDLTLDILTSGMLLDARVALAARTGVGDLTPWATYPAARPVWPLDGVFATPDLLPLTAAVIGDGRVSDHRGLLVEYALLEPQGAAVLAAWHGQVRGRGLERLLACHVPESDLARALTAGWRAALVEGRIDGANDSTSR